MLKMRWSKFSGGQPVFVSLSELKILHMFVILHILMILHVFVILHILVIMHILIIIHMFNELFSGDPKYKFRSDYHSFL